MCCKVLVFPCDPALSWWLSKKNKSDQEAYERGLSSSCYPQAEMQDKRSFLPEKPLAARSQKKKTATQKASRRQGDNVKRSLHIRSPALQVVQKVSKRSLSNEASPLFQRLEKSNSDSFTDISTSENEYRALRRKYLRLEDESFEVGRELEEVEDEIKALEEEKLTLLDELLVLEGLVDRSEIPSQGRRLQ